MPPKAKAGKSQEKYLLVRWTEDESVGVTPISAVVDKDKVPYPGALMDMRWGSGKSKKAYQAEVLKISCVFAVVLCPSSFHTHSIPWCLDFPALAVTTRSYDV